MNASKSPVAWSRALRPLLVVIAALAAGMLLIAPMVTMEPKDLPLAVLDLDEGFTTPQGEIEAGQLVVDAVVENDADGMIAWRLLESQQELDDALENNEIYAALIVPADFSESQIMAQQGLGEPAETTLMINEGKHPMVSAQLSGTLGQLTAGTDVAVTTQAYNEIPAAVGLAATILPMVFMILVYIASYAGGIVTRASFPLDARRRRAGSAGIQLGIAAVAAALTGVGAAWALTLFVPDLDFSFGGAAVFLAIASFALMTLVIGSINWLGTPGMIVPVAILLLGMGTANLPFEFLPAFWQEWIYPWNPLRFLAEGARALLFQGAGWWNAATSGLIITGVIGIVLVATSILTPRGRADAGRRPPAG